MVNTSHAVSKIWDILELVKDPEIPVLSVVDLGIVRDVIEDAGKLEVHITPTYSGCPAMDMIASEISTMLKLHGYADPTITTVLSPVWTTDWMTTEGRDKLRDYGIAPPSGKAADKGQALFDSLSDLDIECPKCNSTRTEKVSEFGSTSCKALYKCLDCHEPFDYFKCI
jgi:ring-1,2-phenylacetyl-CoA epoxidase subunit PaaD